MTCRVWRLSVSDPRFDQAVELFDGYRRHHGADPAPVAVERWLRAQTAAERLLVFAADDRNIGVDRDGTGDGLRRGRQDGTGQGGTGDRVDGRLSGLLTVSVVPASLTLRTAWLIRDLYVDPVARRRGVARALLANVTDAATRAGAHRLSLQTELDNQPALTLYASAGFAPVTGLALLNLSVADADG